MLMTMLMLVVVMRLLLAKTKLLQQHVVRGRPPCVLFLPTVHLARRSTPSRRGGFRPF